MARDEQNTEPELDAFMRHSGDGIPLLLDAGHLAFAGGDVLRAIDRHHKRINHVHVKDIRQPVIDGLAKPVQIVQMGATVSDLVNHAALAAYGALSRKR